jgi:hypothetical protein
MQAHQVLTPDAHRDLRILTEAGACGGEFMMSSVAMPSEFRRLQNDYPILFRRNAEQDGFTALALFGFQTGENLFVEDGRWEAHALPLAIRVQPFLIGRPADPARPKQVHIDMASPRIVAGEGTRVFDADGRPTPYLESIADALGALDAGLQDCPAFFQALARYDLLEPFTLDVTLDDGAVNRLVGFHTIDEDRLRALDGEALADLHGGGHLMPMFMALASLSSFRGLIARKNRRVLNG